MVQKIQYFLKTFQGSEWSGPAWYSIEKDKLGFPVKMVMEYFHPLHLGTAIATDWEGKELLKVYKDLVAKFPEIGKTWIQGNIHSHHDMGAYFSSVDKDQLIDDAHENFYGSLVVSTKPGKEYAFAISYPDQYNQTHIIPGEVIEDLNNDIDKNIVDQAKYIQNQKAKRSKTVKTKIKTTNKRQTQIFDEPLFEDVHELPAIPGITNLTPEEEEYEKLYMTCLNQIKEEQFEEFDRAWINYETGIITREQLGLYLNKMGVKINGSNARITL
jgi:hypothetical protein